MLQKLNSRQINWLILVGILLLVVELSFFDGGTIFLLLVGVGCVYLGRSKLPSTSGKVFFWTGIVFLILTVLNMLAIRFLLLGILIYFILRYARSKKEPQRIEPEIVDPLEGEDAFGAVRKEKELIRKQPLFDPALIGRHKTPEHVYEWNDVNIVSGVGDTVIDLSFTVLPKGESVIVIRHLIGNVLILVPYDLEVRVQHASVFGKASVFDYHEPRLINQSLDIRTGGYDQGSQKVKILTSMVSGDLVVRRV